MRLIFSEQITTPDDDGNDCDGGGGGDDGDDDDINSNFHLSSAYWVSGIVLSTTLALIHLILKES